MSIALFVDRKPLVAVLLNPILDQLYTAAAGQGALLNGKRISVSKTARRLDTAILICQAGTT